MLSVQSPSAIVIGKTLISCFRKERFRFQNGPDFTSCSGFSTPFPLEGTMTTRFFNNKGTISDLLSQLTLPTVFQGIAKFCGHVSDG